MKVKTDILVCDIPHIDLRTGERSDLKVKSKSNHKIPITCDLLIENLLSYYGLPGIPDPLPWGYGSYISLIDRVVIYWHYIPFLTGVEFKPTYPIIDIWYSDRLTSQFSDGNVYVKSEFKMTSLYGDFHLIQKKLSQKIECWTGCDIDGIRNRYQSYMRKLGEEDSLF